MNGLSSGLRRAVPAGVALTALAVLITTAVWATHLPTTTSDPLIVSGGVPPVPDLPASTPLMEPCGSSGDDSTASGNPVAVPAPCSEDAEAAGRAELREWAGRVAAGGDVPARAVVAYGAAQLRVRAEGCRATWATLAAIGQVESHHGRYQDRTLRADGRPSRPIIGIALDGTPGVRAMPDVDGGRLDGDTVWERAVGPMQFLPATWARFGTDGDDDGVADPQDLDDAALSAARYLCAGGRDLGTGPGWAAAVRAYNASDAYVRQVHGLAGRYAILS